MSVVSKLAHVFLFSFVLVEACAAGALLDAPFSGASNYSLIVSGDANLGSGVHVHGGAYIGGDVTLSGSNTSVGSDIPLTRLGLYVGGDVLSSQSIDLLGHDYYIAGSNAATLNNPGTALTVDPLGGQSVAIIAQALDSKSAQLAALSDTGVAVDASDFNQIRIDLTAGVLNVIDWNSANAGFLQNGNAGLVFNNFTDDTLVVINYDLGAGLELRAKVLNLATSLYDNLIWNFVGTADLLVANSVATFKGTLIASDSHVTWQANDIDGQLIAENLSWLQTSQSHYFQPWQEVPNMPVSAPGALVLLVSVLPWMRRGRRGVKST